MRLLSVTQCRPGDVVADTIRQADGRVVLRHGVALTQDMLDSLARWQIGVVPIEWPGFETIDTETWFPVNLIAPMTNWVGQGLKMLEGDGLVTARRLVKELVEYEPRPRHRALEFLSVYHGGNPGVVAWLNTVALVMKLAKETAWKWVENYTLAAVLLGLTLPINAGTVGEPAPDHAHEMVERLHAHSAVPSTTIACLAQHHARWDGSGVPSLSSDEIYHGALILGLAEQLTVLTFRTNEPAVPVHEALEWIIGGADIEFPLPLIQSLQRVFAPYPRGSVVTLGGGEVAVVLDNVTDWPTRPYIRLLNGSEAGRDVELKAPDQQTRVIMGFYEGRDWPA